MRNCNFWKKSLVGLLILPLAICLGAATAQAGTAVNASIVNVVKVDYQDASGTTSFTQSASATVSVTLLAAAPTISDPTPVSGRTVDSGAIQNYNFAIYSNSNGPDTYDLDLADGTTTDSNYTTRDKYIASITDPQGGIINYAPGTTAVADIAIGATVITGDNGSDTLHIPAGTGTANGIILGDLVVINNVVYEIASITDGTPASYNAAGHALTAETLGTITLNDSGGTPVGDVTGLTGSTISEYYVVTTGVTAVADSLAAADAVVYFNLTLTSDTDTNLEGTKDDTQTFFTRSQLTITKTANPTSAKPGDSVEYTIVISVLGSAASKVVTTDAVPDYTTLINDGTNFATVYDGTSTVTITLVDTDTEDSTVASGNATAATAGSPITFYLGTGNNGNSAGGNETGGTVAAAATYTIVYSVIIN